jgi:Tfp pilus assembly protein PilX
MRTRLRRLGNERGFALVLALATTVVLGMSVTSVIVYTTSNQRSSNLSRTRVSARDLAEAGLNNALSIISKGNGFDQHALHPQAPYQPADCANPPLPPSGVSLGNTCSTFTDSYDGGTVTYWGWYDGPNQLWTITSTGSVRNAFASQDSKRTIVAKAHVRAVPSQDNDVTAWNYVFAKAVAVPAACDVTIDNSVALAVSLYIEGNLCMKNTGQIAETNADDPVNLEVRGKLVWLNGSSKGIGEKGPPISQQVTTAKIAGGCGTTSVTNATHTCAPPGDWFYVKAGGYSTTAPPIDAPVLTDVDYQGYYNSAMPGPLHPCDNPGPTGLGTRLANTTWDNDTTALNGSLGNGSAALFNLTPSTSYNCHSTDAYGNVVGALDWNATTHVLSIRGVIYIDGSAYINNGVTNSYRGVDSAGNHPSGSGSGDGLGGQATLYLSGNFSMSQGGTQLCGWSTTTDSAAVTSGNCDFTKWTPNTSMLIVAAHGTGNSVSLANGARFQGGLFSQNNVDIGQSSQIEGPIISNTLTVGNSATLKPLPIITNLPIGAPGNPNSKASVDDVSYTTG